MQEVPDQLINLIRLFIVILRHVSSFETKHRIRFVGMLESKATIDTWKWNERPERVMMPIYIPPMMMDEVKLGNRTLPIESAENVTPDL